MKMIPLIGAVLCLAGCASPYQEIGFRGGVSAQQVTTDTWRISARGNAYTGKTRIQDFVLMKAAETTKAAGGTHFFVGSSQDATSRDTIVSPGQTTTTFSGRQAFSVTTPGSVDTVIKPGEDTYVRVITLPPRAPVPQGAISAEEIIRFVGPRLVES